MTAQTAPPPLPVYELPPTTQPDLDAWPLGLRPDGFFWVPGAWVPVPYPGALWTPGYWGWSGGLFMWHPGYWGRHIGYYGGVNYGFGYGGIGFAGGEWRGGVFAYNTAVVHVDRRYVHETFEDRGRVERGYVARGSHVAFSGGPGGINHAPSAEERMSEHDQHMGRTAFQQQHVQAAQSDRNSYFKANGGHPRTLAASKPLPMESHETSNGMTGERTGGAAGKMTPGAGNAHPEYKATPYGGGSGRSPSTMGGSHPGNEVRPAERQTYKPAHTAAPVHTAAPAHTNAPPKSNPKPAGKPKPEGHER